jgi:hypothetical protein
MENELSKFFTMQNQRAERNEISTETIKKYFKPIKLFWEMNSNKKLQVTNSNIIKY